jgi:uncharacterized protein
MRVIGTDLVLSATDLSNFLSCRHRTALEMAEAYGKRKRPYFHDPLVEILQQRGDDHEKAYVDLLRSGGRDVVDLNGITGREEAIRRTLEAMRAGAHVIVQGALADGRWYRWRRSL